MEAIAQTKTLAERTYDILIDAICSGELRPGERLNQDDIATRLNVSRQPVNSAISILKANGFAKDTGRRSVVVTAIEPWQFKDIFEFRSVIEPFAVTRAAGQLPSGAQEEAQDIMQRGRLAVAENDNKALLHADAAFHQMIYRWSGNHVIENTMRFNWHHIHRAMNEVLREPAAPARSWEAHERIITALLANQPDVASAEMALHIEQAKQKTMPMLDQSLQS